MKFIQFLFFRFLYPKVEACLYCDVDLPIISPKTLMSQSLPEITFFSAFLSGKVEELTFSLGVGLHGICKPKRDRSEISKRNNTKVSSLGLKDFTSRNSIFFSTCKSLDSNIVHFSAVCRGTIGGETTAFFFKLAILLERGRICVLKLVLM